MKITADKDGVVLFEEVYNGVMMRTSERHRIGVVMRDDTFEINVLPKGSKEPNWWRVNMQEGTIESMTPRLVPRKKRVIEEIMIDLDQLQKALRTVATFDLSTIESAKLKLIRLETELKEAQDESQGS